VPAQLPFEVEAVLFGKSENTKRTVKALVRRFLKSVGKPLRDVEPEDVDRYLMLDLAGRKQSAQLLLLYLEKAFAYAGKLDLAEHCKVRRRGIRVYEEERRRGYLTEEELAKVVETLDRWAANRFNGWRRRAAILFKLMIVTGMRLSEALSITRESIGDGVVVVRAKGGKIQAKPVPDEELLEELKKLGSTPFPVSRRTVELWFKRLLEEAGLPRERVKELKVHDLRRTFALILYDKTKDIEAVKAFLGHSFSKTTEIYLGSGVERIEAKRRASMASEVVKHLQSLKTGSKTPQPSSM